MLSPLMQRLEQNFRTHSAHPCVQVGREVLDYAALDRRSRAVAAHVLRTGMRPGSRVGLWFPLSTDFYITLVGVLRAGAAAVILNPDAPEAQTEEIRQRGFFDALIVGERAPSPSAHFHQLLRVPAAAALGNEG